MEMAITTAEATPSNSGPAAYRWTVDRMYRAIEAGVFDHPERIELIHGELIEKMGQNPAHASLVGKMTRRLMARLEPRFTVRPEKPLHIADDGEPVPDIMVVTGTEEDYEQQHPTPPNVVLIVEIADSSTAYDMRDKAKLYARAGVMEYWTVILLQRTVMVHRQPTLDGYRSIVSFSGDQDIALKSAPEIRFVVRELLT